ncbi:nitrite reductase (cytochrome c-552) [Tangfeifania diversioriginum]|uniref:Cytochrome c-552 n=1 Tax=Tangfeifania diversioriginum TaxID=1168035 RepID=A0A1M6IZT8_9BACT|nr:ammonia-forming cytochrome c nitrite reductase [Tangfeifania diversioriginum]SHJ39862.1 nitrite reductase (cytochrome c-552) [Tangfeifania diversioriginum]
MNNKLKITEKRPWLSWVLFFATIVVVFLLGLLASSIVERRMEATFVSVPQADIQSYEPRNEIWGENFPRQFQSYYNTADTSFRSKYGGNAMIDMLAEGPELVVLWAGYGFSKEYNQGRGHYYAIKDVRNILRTGAPTNANDGPMPTTCWTCKSPDVPRVMEQEGVAEFYTGAWSRLGPEIVNPIGCADCHDNETMNLRISRPALIEAYKRMGKDVNKSSYQEMRSLVCAQCHVEYYFNKDIAEGANYLTFPWDNGYTAEAMAEYYDNMEFSDWTHALSRAPMLKAQHPDYEVFMTGIHAIRGVSCADCHMPYNSEGGQKFTDHKMQSPLNNISNSCQVCHREETKRLVQDVYERQDRIAESRVKLEELLVRAHVEAKKAWDLGATENQMEDILQGIRHAQWRWDYVAATHGGSFHSPVEIGRTVANGITIAQETRIDLARLLAELGHNEVVPYPDISTKAKAQEFIGLDMDKLNAEKEEFLETLVPKWDEQAAEREASWDTPSAN